MSPFPNVCAKHWNKTNLLLRIRLNRIVELKQPCLERYGYAMILKSWFKPWHVGESDSIGYLSFR